MPPLRLPRVPCGGVALCAYELCSGRTACPRFRALFCPQNPVRAACRDALLRLTGRCVGRFFSLKDRSFRAIRQLHRRTSISPLRIHPLCLLAKTVRACRVFPLRRASASTFRRSCLHRLSAGSFCLNRYVRIGNFLARRVSTDGKRPERFFGAQNHASFMSFCCRFPRVFFRQKAHLSGRDDIPKCLPVDS